MKKSFLAAAAILSLALAANASAQSLGEKTGVNSVLGVAPTTADFLKETAMSDMTEIATSKLAQERGDADAKTFAGQMITDHTKTSEELKALVGGGVKAEIPPALDDTHQKMVDKLKEAKPENFTSDYASIQVSAHKAQYRCSNATRKAERIRSSRIGPERRFPTCSTILRWRKT